ncbi:HNH endonuclease [Streptomyces sp. NPDC002491]
MRIPAWSEDELVLAGALVVHNGWRELRTSDPRVQELSDLLRSLPIHEADVLALPSFRSPDSVSRKTTDFMTNHRSYTGKATRCGKPTLLMINAFTEREAQMLQAAQAIQEGIGSGELHLIPPQFDEVDETGTSAVEGRLLARWALSRERNPKLRAEKIAQVRRGGGPLRCEVCDFDFARTYGDLGEGFIEVHYATPLHTPGPREITLDDLACICANCHRMCHRCNSGETWHTLSSLQTLMRQSGSEDAP